MRQPTPDRQSQEQDSLIKGTNVGGDLNFAPVQIGTKIETQIIQVLVEKVTKRELIKASPYKGLKRFNFGDREYFFGRDTFIARLFNAVNQSPISLVLGASGSGKSSVVRAGLIPEFKKFLYRDSKTFYDFIFTPGEDPFESLYRCLLNEEKDYTFSESQVALARIPKPETLTQVISTLKKEKERWLFFVDQFEELFTSCDDLGKRNNFIEGLVQAANSQDQLLRIVLAIRSDFLEQFSFYPALGEMANQNNIHLVTEMYPDELQKVIEQPAAKHGVVFEEGLVEQIIKDVEGQSGYLPLLQYTLNLLWESECRTIGSNSQLNIEDRVLNQSSYAALEGVRGALQKRVNEIYQDICEENKDGEVTTKKIFLKLVNIIDSDAGSRAVSRRAYRDEFVGASVEKALSRFIEEKLLVSSSEYSMPEDVLVSKNNRLKQFATVEIAHEILLSSWDILKRWLEQEKEAIILKNWLAGETKRWQKIRLKDESKANDELLKGSRLEQIILFREEEAFDKLGGLSSEENNFINTSVTWSDRQAELERVRKLKKLEAEVALNTEQERNQILNQALEDAEVTIAKAQKKQQRIIRRGLITLAGITVVSIAASMVAFFAFQQLVKAQKGTQLEQASVSLLRQFPAGEITALISALENGEDLYSLVKGSNKLQDYPSIRPLSVLQYILDNIRQRNKFDSQQGKIKSIGFTKNGKQIISAGTDREGDTLIGRIKVWNLSGKQLAAWTAHQEGINYFSLNPNGKQIATAGADGMIRLWNLSGQKLNEQKAYDVIGGVNHLNFNPDGRKLVAAGGDGKLQLWNVSGQQLEKKAEWKAVDQEFAGLRSVVIHPNENKIVSGGDDGIIRLWDFSGKELVKWNPHQNQAILNISFSPNGQRIATIGKDSVAKIWDLSGKLLVQLKGHQGSISSIRFSPDGQHLVTTGGDDLTIRLWDLSGKEVNQLRGHSQVIWSAYFSDDSQYLVSAGRSGKIFLWDLSPKPMVSFQANEADVNSLRFSPDGQQIVTVGDDGMIRLWDNSGKLLNDWSAIQHGGMIRSVSFSPDGERLVVSYNNNRVRIWSIAGEKRNSLDEHNGSVNNVNFSPNGQYIITAGTDGIARLWDVSHNKITELRGHQGSVWDAIFSPDGKLIATTGADGTIKFWDLAGLEQINLEHQGQVRTISFSPDGEEIVSAGDDGKVHLWNLKKQSKTQSFDTSQGIIYSISFSPDGKKIATAGRDGTIRIWDKLGRQLFNFHGKGNPFWDLNFSPDSQFLAVAEDKGIVYVFKINNLEQLLNQGCDWLQYYLQANPASLKNLNKCRKK